MVRILVSLGVAKIKKPFGYLIFFVIICFLSNIAIQNRIGKEFDKRPPYYLSFASVGANLLESRLDCWAKIKTVSNNEEVDRALLKVLNYLDLPAEQNKFLHQESREAITTQYELHHKDQYYLFILQTNKTNNESYLLVTATSPKDDLQLRKDEKKLKALLNCKSYYLYKGSINARPDIQGQQDLLQIVMKCLHAQTNEVFNNQKMVSMTGFSPNLENIDINPVKVAGRNCNVQAAIRTNDKENKSEIYIGFPLLLNDY